MDRRAGGGGDKVGDSNPEAKARGHSVEMNIAGFDFAGDRYAVIECPGSVEFSPRPTWPFPPWTWLWSSPIPIRPGHPAAADPARTGATGVPRALFVNHWTRPAAPWTTCWPPSPPPAPCRWWPPTAVWQDEHVTGYIDLALERTYIYRPNEPSEAGGDAG